MHNVCNEWVRFSGAVTECPQVPYRDLSVRLLYIRSTKGLVILGNSLCPK